MVIRPQAIMVSNECFHLQGWKLFISGAVLGSVVSIPAMAGTEERIDNMHLPRVLIAGVTTGAGKTTLTLGILAALRQRGLKVQPFKVGPDYIDSGLHYHAAGVRSHNLDSWMGSAEVVKTVFVKNAAQAQISVIEGVMGLYDTGRGHRLRGSTAHVAMILKAPVILVVNAKVMGQSIVAMVKGYIDYEPGINIQGVILNNAGVFHQTEIVPRLEEELGVRVLGCLGERPSINIPERHLGLLPGEENQSLAAAIAAMGEFVNQEIDLDSLLKLAGEAPDLKGYNTEVFPPQGLKVGIARDEAFSFYYQDSLDYLQELGAELCFFSPLRDRTIPAVDGLYLGGGFPEMFLQPLGNNRSMIDSIRSADQQGMPILAECGGFMYLTESITDFAGHTWPGAGIIPAQVEMSNRLQALGYVEATATHDSIIACQGDVVRGHEFHYSRLNGVAKEQHAFILRGGMGTDGRADGYLRGNLLASYVHLHLRSNPQAAKYFLAACNRYKSAATVSTGKPD